jgi:L-threonylcarbamoyladenylate synthase
MKNTNPNLMNLIKNIKEGKIFIYPTDTIYGIGCDATNKEAVNKIRNIKQRDNKPFSIIAPSINWIKKNCIIDKGLEINKYLPGPYTIILKKKNKSFLSWVSKTDSLGIRIPDNGFCKKIQKTGIPFITTSVNLSKEPFAKSINEIKQEIKNKVDIIIKSENESNLSGMPSTLIINGKEIKR